MNLPNDPIRPELTQRECEILRLISKGHDNRVVAETLGLARSTVESHVHNILRKIGAANRTEAVAIAIHHGLIDGDNS